MFVLLASLHAAGSGPGMPPDFRLCRQMKVAGGSGPGPGGLQQAKKKQEESTAWLTS